MIKKKDPIELIDANSQLISQWFDCHLSKQPLTKPIVGCFLGKLYNKQAIIELLLNPSNYGDSKELCPNISSLKDVVNLNLKENVTFGKESEEQSFTSQKTRDKKLSSKFVCPISLKEMNGN